MAALNFTLDESQSLKAIYRGHLERREKQEGPNPGLVAGLGELYEFDQEYETARYHYRHAIDILDDDLCKRTGSQDAVREILQGRRLGMENARTFLPWGEARLRLMLQIGMTFETARSLEHAVTEYRSARTLARALVKACLALDTKKPRWSLSWLTRRDEFQTGRFHTFKSLNILFQPFFAEAWASEKITSTIDTSNLLIEGGLWELRKLLPFVKRPQVVKSANPVDPAHTNLALTIAQLHNKAGDLYFFKGRQPVTWEQVTKREFWTTGLRIDRVLAAEKSRVAKQDQLTEGYLLRAHYHYAVSLHEIRRYIYHRVESSENRLSLATGGGKTLLGEALPDLLYRAVANSVNDMAEATLGRVSFFGLIRALARDSIDQSIEVKNLEEKLIEWLQYSDGRTGEKRSLVLHGRPLASNLSNWLGKWDTKKRDFRDPEKGLITFEGPDNAVTRFLISIHLCKAGARFFEKGGYLEDAARELLQVCAIVTRMLWWFRAVEVCRTWADSQSGAERNYCSPITHDLIGNSIIEIENALLPFGHSSQRAKRGKQIFMRHLAEFVLDALQKSKSLFLQSRHRLPRRRAASSGHHNAHKADGDLIPSDALTLTCSLGLWLESRQNTEYDPIIAELKKYASSWHEAYLNEDFARTLRSYLEWQRYPALNRLNALQVLIDDHVLNPGSRTDAETAAAYIEELLELNEQYAAPLHFTPHQTGTTCALFWLKYRREFDGDSHDSHRVFRTAQRSLRTSEEMCTLRRGFYEAVSDLYYLYDDFNDRQVHFKHALQMTGVELTTVLRHLLDVAGWEHGASRDESSCSKNTLQFPHWLRILARIMLSAFGDSSARQDRT